ncbi:hypothetical protein MMC13_003416 [Lambiella insularis]|nr:hypothetical protein [Lambiella insularis]
MARVLDLTSCLQSPLATILAGENHRRLSVHSFVLSESSSLPLRALISGPWKECVDRTIDWSHTDVETVQRVISFLYFNDYEAPDPNVRTPSNNPASPDENTQDAVKNAGHDEGGRGLPQEEPMVPGSPEPESEPELAVEEPAADWPELTDTAIAASPELLPARSVDSIDEPQAQSALFESTSERPLTPVGACVGLPPVSFVRQTFAGVFADGHFPYDQYSYTATLLAHAQVYCFADCHFLEPLKNLALQRLSQTLRRVNCEFAAAGDEVARLITYIYENTRSDVPEEPLRKLISQFATINYTSLLRDDFEDLLSRGGDFTRDVARKLLRRLTSHRHVSEIDGEASDESRHLLQLQLTQKEDEVKRLEEELHDANAWGRGFGRKKGRR